MIIKTLLHFDSIDGTEIYDSILKTTHCYNTRIKINKPLQNIKEINLKTLEMPLFLIILDILIVPTYFQLNSIIQHIIIYLLVLKYLKIIIYQ